MGITNINGNFRNTIVVLRILIGWHFLYEGVIKLYNPEWTSFGYLATAQGPLKFLFVPLANENIIQWVDIMNCGALVIVGITFILGIYEKLGAFIGVALLALYYWAHPPFPWLTQLNVEGSYWFVNKNLIELVGCLIIYQFPTGDHFGFKRIFSKTKQITKTEEL
ncbi:DoxX family membrane protein [Muriicola sp. Z0-33]|uniref:DoxX family membrane protein n=1 Tax=Muriicola sp. Z0-33 TaxID=2816957 RepID=UPI002237EEAB|nr:DoxX family membrane protein [Muriicola sp. Z0-33]MCW5515060.1 DoxX family membrane protein [Muriicola sp. Z0-33]